ncbi:ABC transporter ATP-binding protein [Agrobacterium rhizogenes]|uniref:ABC transporter ATP-binding protein n=1 Tax=Rhizobium rhizogenes NBRC 13257 TaxID=1220581 RepID=A0AA87U4D4_RHIRH|nr:ABC transporter ATP-binding protein [Rhizobium rhizogenes]OCJ02160.1 microcin ABC transporter ATP-binding protein [Agrobacterium sp. 13-626]OCJ15610.1 microcin ABC transporter ATP-binding protein [Agrobacterium sp. B133/95]NTF58352.1 ABC transporter ATP-binding protein [Rhizobium rhizogenes]NTF77934.1 ABC transporter ATP-binding protein [Rhizobium rhizogenes]NTF84522.1 ABC transporter ATP-binding protein [Rhizobium rhizogenes]
MTNVAEPVLSIRNLTIDLPRGGDRPHAVSNLSLEIREKEILCIVGESGSGKSITSFAAMGLLPKVLKPSAGEILFEGRDVLKLSEAEHSGLRGNHMGMIFQEPMSALNPCYTVGDQIEEVFKAHTTLSKTERRERTMALLKEVRLPEPERLYHAYPHQLSGGQRQRIVIAIALAMEPRLLIADEPTTALDVTTQAQILDMFKALKESRKAGILFVTHDFDVVAEIADRVVVMQKGVVVEQGSVEQVLNNPRHPYTRMLIDAVPKRHGGKGDPKMSAPIALRVAGIEKTFSTARTFFKPARKVQAVKPTDFTVLEGQTLGIVGESGSGKTTLVRCLMGLVEPDEGSIWIGNDRLDTRTVAGRRNFRKHIQIVFQDPYGSLNPRRTIGDLLVEGPVNFGVPRKQAIEKARELMRIVRLEEDALDRYPVQFSGGQRQRISIARALMVEPKILIADEAVSALDVSVQKDVLKLLDDIRKSVGLTVIFITHDLRVAAEISDHILVMSKGEVVEYGAVDDIFGNPQHSYTRQLLAAMPGRGWEAPNMAALSAADATR